MKNFVERVLLPSVPYAALVAIAAIWAATTVSAPPQIVPSADGGNVASIVAAHLYPDRFTTDPVFSNPSNYQFYQTLMIQAVEVVARLTGDIGTAYMWMGPPLVLLQMVGFFLLGRNLFGGRIWPFVLAVMSVPPVYIFAGELWGMLASPLTRATFAAVFPFLILAGLSMRQSWQILPVMLLCGASIYLHPVSAPSVALGVLTMMLFTKPLDQSWPRHFVWAIGGGLLFLVSAVPFGMGFVRTFASSETEEIARVLAETLRTNVGDQYYSVAVAVSQFIATVFLSAPLWILVIWIAAIVAPFVLLVHVREHRVLTMLALVFGLAAGTVAISLLDQTIAVLRGSHPLQIDLIRNLRFFVPVMLILLVWMLAKITEQRTARRWLSPALGTILIAAWWGHYPNPIVGQTALSRPTVVEEDRRLLSYLAALPVGSRILPLPYVANSEEVSMLALAIRYEALQPTSFLYKDMNFLSYSGSDEIVPWHTTMRALQSIDDGTASEDALKGVILATNTDYVLVHESASVYAKAATQSLDGNVQQFGKWELIDLN